LTNRGGGLPAPALRRHQRLQGGQRPRPDRVPPRVRDDLHWRELRLVPGLQRRRRHQRHRPAAVPQPLRRYPAV